MKPHSPPPTPLSSLNPPSFPFQFPRILAPRKIPPPRRPFLLLLVSLNPTSPVPLLSRASHAPFSSPIDDFIQSPDPHATEIELLDKPFPIPVPDAAADEADASASRKPPELEEALAPFLKLFRSGDSAELSEQGRWEASPEPRGQVGVSYYEPKAGDLVVGVVVSGNENRLDVNVGADMLGTMLTKEVLPLYEGELPHGLCDLEKGAGEFMAPGKIGVLKEEDAFAGMPAPGRPVVEVGTVLFAEVLGRTLSGRPLLSTRRMFRRVAWHRVRQIKQLNEPIEVKIFEWNTGGLLTRIEGLRAFLPKAELMNRINNFKELKENVGRQLFVSISRIDEESNDLIISEKEAWDMLYLKEGTLLEGTVRKIFPYGVQVRIGETNRSGLLHISNISRSRITSLTDFLELNEKVKVLVVKSMFPEKISLSIADLESEPGLFLSDKERVFSEAEEMAKRYKRRLPVVTSTHKLDPLPVEVLPFDDESRLYANWKWFKFERHEELNPNGNIVS